MTKCNCETLGRTLDGTELFTTHGIGCPAREVELRELFRGLASGIEEWASQEDGVYDKLWPHYVAVKQLIGHSVNVESA